MDVVRELRHPTALPPERSTITRLSGLKNLSDHCGLLAAWYRTQHSTPSQSLYLLHIESKLLSMFQRQRGVLGGMGSIIDPLVWHQPCFQLVPSAVQSYSATYTQNLMYVENMNCNVIVSNALFLPRLIMVTGIIIDRNLKRINKLPVTLCT